MQKNFKKPFVQEFVHLVLVAALLGVGFLTGCAKGVDPKPNSELPPVSSDPAPASPTEGAPSDGDSAGTDTPIVLPPIFEPADPTVSYEFRDTNAQEKTCTTGVQKFSSTKEMCLGIQDPKRNADCAFAARNEHYLQHCAENPKVPYGFYESLRCGVRLLNINSQINSVGNYKREDVFASKELCIGWGKDGSLRPAKTSLSSLYEEVSISVSGVFTSEKVKPEDNDSKLVLALVNKNKEKIAGPITFKDGASIYTGTTSDNTFKYVVVCGRTWACD